MVRLLSAALLLAAVLSGCLAPKAEDLVRDWHPLGSEGLTLGQALLASPYRKNIVWEDYAGEADAVMVRASVEYDPASAGGVCPAGPADMARAARVFLLLEFSVSPAGEVTFSAAREQAYSAKGYFEETPLDLAVMADLMTRTFPLPCDGLDLPNYL